VVSVESEVDDHGALGKWGWRITVDGGGSGSSRGGQEGETAAVVALLGEPPGGGRTGHGRRAAFRVAASALFAAARSSSHAVLSAMFFPRVDVAVGLRSSSESEFAVSPS
jgi:hypothetical protein